MEYEGVKRSLLCVMIAAAMLAVAAASSVGPTAAVLGDAPGQDDAVAPESEDDSARDWTIAMYWASDNNLDEYTDYFVSLWRESLTNTEDVALCVFLDRVDVPANISTLTEDGWVEQESLGEVNSSSAETLAMFVEYALTEPALASDNFMLMVQDHGNGYLGLCCDEGLPEAEGAEAWMSIDGLGAGIRDALDASGKSIDIVALDACTLGTVEIAYELRGVAPYLVVSELGVPFDGMNYAALLGGLSEDPAIEPLDLACKLVDDYEEWYSAPLGTYPTLYPYMQDFASLSVIDLSAMESLVDAFSAFREAVIPKDNSLGYYLKTAAMQADPEIWLNNMGVWTYPDIMTMFTILGDTLEEEFPEVAAAADALVEAADLAIIHDWASWRMKGVPTGLSVYVCPSIGQFVVNWDVFDRDYDGVGLDFVEDSGWDLVLKEYFYTVKQYGDPLGE